MLLSQKRPARGVEHHDYQGQRVVISSKEELDHEIRLIEKIETEINESFLRSEGLEKVLQYLDMLFQGFFKTIYFPDCDWCISAITIFRNSSKVIHTTLLRDDKQQEWFTSVMAQTKSTLVHNSCRHYRPGPVELVILYGPRCLAYDCICDLVPGGMVICDATHGHYQELINDPNFVLLLSFDKYGEPHAKAIEHRKENFYVFHKLKVLGVSKKGKDNEKSQTASD